MPFYEYVCTVCATRVEVLHGVNDAGPVACAECGGALRRALSPPAIVFKGSGWAKKDARRSTAAQSEPSDKPADATAKADTAKADTKREAKDAASG
jgi:putative FmdB family regulatory protein